MKNYKKTLYILFLISLIMLPSFNNSFSVSSATIEIGESLPVLGNYLVEGTATYDIHDITARGSSETSLGIDYQLENDCEIEVSILRLDEDTVQFTKDYTFIPGLFYQIDYLDDYHYPDYYQVRFYDEFGYYLADQSSLSFEMTTYVDTKYGSRSYCSTPYDAYWATLYAVFLDYDYYGIYYGLRHFYWLGDYSSSTNLFEKDALLWDISDSPYSGYTVTRFDEYQGYNTVILSEDYPEGETFTTFKNEIHFETLTGFYVKQDILVEKYDYYDYTVLQLDDVSALVDDGDPTVNGPTLIEVKNTKPVTLTYTGYDINYDHYNFYKDGVLIETNSVWKANFTFEVTPEKKELTIYTFEIVDSLGNSNSIDTTVSHIGGVPGFTISISLLTLYGVVVIRKKTKKRKQ